MTKYAQWTRMNEKASMKAFMVWQAAMLAKMETMMNQDLVHLVTTKGAALRARYEARYGKVTR